MIKMIKIEILHWKMMKSEEINFLKVKILSNILLLVSLIIALRTPVSRIQLLKKYSSIFFVLFLRVK